MLVFFQLGTFWWNVLSFNSHCSWEYWIDWNISLFSLLSHTSFNQFMNNSIFRKERKKTNTHTQSSFFNISHKTFPLCMIFKSACEHVNRDILTIVKFLCTFCGFFFLSLLRTIPFFNLKLWTMTQYRINSKQISQWLIVSIFYGSIFFVHILLIKRCKWQTVAIDVKQNARFKKLYLHTDKIYYKIPNKIKIEFIV